MKKFITIISVLSFFLIFTASSSHAESVESKTEQAVLPHVHKFSRGLINVGTAPFELPKQMIKNAQEGDGLAGELAGYVTGIFTGIGWTVCRFGSGVVDILSAPFPGNEAGLIKPEFISDEHILDEP